MPAKGKRTMSESSGWQAEYLRRFEAIRGSLRSLQIDSEQRLAQYPESNALKKMAHHFGRVSAAFEELNRPAPKEPQSEDFLPGPKPPAGRREFISDLKAGT